MFHEFLWDTTVPRPPDAHEIEAAWSAQCAPTNFGGSWYLRPLMLRHGGRLLVCRYHETTDQDGDPCLQVSLSPFVPFNLTIRTGL